MSAHSLQTRTVVAAAIAILVALVIVGAGVDVLVARDLHHSLDRTLRDRAAEVSRLSVSAPALLTTPGALDSPLGGTPLSVEVVDRRGRIVARSLSLGGRLLPVGATAHAAIRSGRGSYSTLRLGGDTLRAYSAPLPDVGGPAAGGAVVVAVSTADLRSTLTTLHLFTFLAALVAALVAAVAVALLMRQALRPLGRLAHAAGEIERTGDPRRRLPQPATDDEVGRLAATLNAMLGGLERSRENERRFLADASHELRTPLTALRGNVDYLVRHGATPEVVAELEHDAERIARLADDLLTLSREEGAERPDRMLRLDELARSFVAPDVDVDAPSPVAVLGQREALERALSNLVENARLHGPDGGRIRVEVGANGDAARVTVTDEGLGLQPYEAERAFGRFWRGSHGRPGSGLGLAIVQATAERHGGRASASGSAFTIELPLLRDLSQTAGTTCGEEPRKGSP